MAARGRLARLHGRRPVHGPRLDRVDAGLPVRLRGPAVRRHRRRAFLELGRARTLERMAPHLTHVGVHDHGFNNVSTYGNLWRLAAKAGSRPSDWERHFYELALKVSGAVQARRWTRLPGRRLHLLLQRPALAVRRHDPVAAVLALAHRLGHRLVERAGRADQPARAPGPARAAPRRTTASSTATAATATMCADASRTRRIFNTNNGSFRCPNSQQGYSPFSTWTRGLAWAMLGFAEQLEFLDTLTTTTALDAGSADAAARRRLDDARRPRATCDFYIDHATASDGIPYWDTGAPGLRAARRLADARRRSVQRPRAGRQLRRRDRARRGCCGSAAT